MPAPIRRTLPPRPRPLATAGIFLGQTMISLMLHEYANLLREEHIEVTLADRIYAAVIDIALITWLGWIVSLLVHAVLP